MVIPRHMQIAVTIQPQADDIMRIPDVAGVLRSLRFPLIRTQCPFRQHHRTARIIVSGVLMRRVGDNRALTQYVRVNRVRRMRTANGAYRKPGQIR